MTESSGGNLLGLHGNWQEGQEQTLGSQGTERSIGEEGRLQHTPPSTATAERRERGTILIGVGTTTGLLPIPLSGVKGVEWVRKRKERQKKKKKNKRRRSRRRERERGWRVLGGSLSLSVSACLRISLSAQTYF